MGKIQDCYECAEYTNWGMPDKVTEQNYEYAKHCLRAREKSFVCGQTMRTKPKGHKQQCKHFKEMEDWQRKIRQAEEREKEAFAGMIKDYEDKHCPKYGDWISCKDKLPPVDEDGESDYYLVQTDRAKGKAGYMVSYYRNDLKCWDCETDGFLGKSGITVSAWTPLPAICGGIK